MHFKGIVDFALFSSGIHILTLNVLLLSSENMARSMDESKGQNTESLRVQFFFEDSTQQSVNNLIIKVSHLEQLTQTICYVCILFHCSPCLVSRVCLQFWSQTHHCMGCTWQQMHFSCSFSMSLLSCLHSWFLETAQCFSGIQTKGKHICQNPSRHNKTSPPWGVCIWGGVWKAQIL